MAGKISLGLSIVLAIAVGYLFVNQPSAPAEQQNFSQEETRASVAEGDFPLIAYIDEDTLLSRYEYYLDKQPVMNQRLMRKQRKLEEEFAYYQDQVAKFQQSQASFSEQEIRIQMEAFAKMERDLDSKQRELQKIELDFLSEVQERILNYIEDYCDSEGIDLMLTHRSDFTSLIYREGLFNATEDILEGLNQEYALETGGEENGE